MTTNKPTCKLSGTDGNVFSIISKVKFTLDRAAREDDSLKGKGNEFAKLAMKCKSYDAVLQLCFDYVDVK